MADDGSPKVTAAARRLRALNPEISVNAYDEMLTAQNALALFAQYDIVIDGTDNFAAKFLINDAAIKTGKPVIYAAIQGFEGRISVFGLANGPCYRCLYPAPPEAAVQNCAEAGVIGALAGIVGTAQAMEAIKLIVADNSFKPLAGRLWMIDTRTMETRIMTVHKKADCPTCAQDRDVIDLQSAAGPACDMTIREITADEAASMTDAVLVDVREMNEWQAGHIEGATLAPLSALKLDTGSYTPPAGRPCILYCARGVRSLMAAEILREAGFGNLYSMKGGYEAWRQRA
jgi:rhodanese-related sulfurtransferase